MDASFLSLSKLPHNARARVFLIDVKTPRSNCYSLPLRTLDRASRSARHAALKRRCSQLSCLCSDTDDMKIFRSRYYPKAVVLIIRLTDCILKGADAPRHNNETNRLTTYVMTTTHDPFWLGFTHSTYHPSV